MTDLRSIPDDQLMQMYQQMPQERPGVPRITVRPEGTSRPLSEWSDEELTAAYKAPQAATFASRFDASEIAPQVPQSQQNVTSFLNQGSAAGQRTTPDIAAHMPNLVSADTFESDSGEVWFRDPATGKDVLTDQNKHIALRDPTDNKVRVFARTPETDEGMLSAAGRLIGTGSAAGAVTRRPAVPTLTVAERTKASDIFSTAKAPYRAFKAEASGVDIPEQAALDIAERLRGSLTKANLIPELAQPIYSAVGILEKGEPLTLDALQNVKRVIGRGFNSPDKNVRDAASVASAEIGKIISEFSKSAGQNLKTGDAIHATAMAVQDLQRKSDIAGLRTGRAGYGGNAVNNMRQVLSPIVQKAIEGRKTLYRTDEIKAMRDIVEGTTATNLFRGIGQLSPSKGSIPTTIAGATLGVSAVIGGASNKLATILTSKQIERLNELVAKRSPAYAEAVQKAVSRYEKAQLEFINDPSPGALARYVAASRALSSGLTRDGVAVTSGDLMRQIGRTSGSAEEDQQEPERVVGE